MNTIEIESRKNEGKNQNETKDGFDLDDETVDFRYLTDWSDRAGGDASRH